MKYDGLLRLLLFLLAKREWRHFICLGATLHGPPRPVICFVGAKGQAWDSHSAGADCS